MIGAMHAIRVAPTRPQADEWALVLTAAGIPNAVEDDPMGWAVLIAPDDSLRADAMLTAYDNERRDDARRAEEIRTAVTEPYPWMSGIALGLALLSAFSVTGPWAASSWVERGANAAARVMAGELWRTVTALTLHADVIHVVGNACALAVLLPPLIQRFGGGLALLLLLGAGALGNGLAAWAHDPRHVAVGASTAAFGAVGILVALRLLPGDEPKTAKRWTAPVAGVVLLGTLGTGPRADLGAHVFGFLAGGLIGLGAAAILRRRPRPVMQWTLGALAALVVIACWRLALVA